MYALVNSEHELNNCYCLFSFIFFCFNRWQSGGAESQEVHISHPVTNFEFLYEPFYVAPDTVPPHDERFVGYGYTRNTQVFNTCLMICNISVST